MYKRVLMFAALGILFIPGVAQAASSKAGSMLSTGDVGAFCFLAAVLLVPAYVFGWFCKRIGLPEFIGPIAVGLLLGRSVLGNLYTPALDLLIPAESGVASLLWLASFMGAATLMFDAGLAVRLKTVMESRDTCMRIGVAGLIPMVALGCGLLGLGHMVFQPEASSPFRDALIVISLMSIAPLVVIYKLLDECHLLGCDLASVKLGSSAIAELIALMGVSLMLGVCAGVSGLALFLMVPALGGALLMLSGGRILDKVSHWLSGGEKHGASVRVIVVLVALGGAYFWFFSLPVMFGFFMAGVLLNTTQLVNGQVRHFFTRVAHQFCVPLFFVMAVFNIDFLNTVNVPLLLTYTAVALLCKGGITWFLARRAGMTKLDARLTAFAFMPIAVAGIAMGQEFMGLGMLGEEVFTAFLGATVLTTVIGGVLFKVQVGHPDARRLLAVLDRSIVQLDEVKTLPELFTTLSEKTAATLKLDAGELSRLLSVTTQQSGQPPAANGTVLLHAQHADVQQPRLILGRLSEPLAIPSYYGGAVSLVALLVVPEGEDGQVADLDIWPLAMELIEVLDGQEVARLSEDAALEKVLTSVR